MNRVCKATEVLASLKLTVVCLTLLAILVFAGTVYEASHGLYEACRVFFDSWFFLIGGIVPFPGTQLVLCVLFVNLLLSLALRFRFAVDWIGLWLLHGGLLILLVGGFVIHRTTKESFLELVEGESSNVSIAPHEWEIALWRGTASEEGVTSFDMGRLRAGDTLHMPSVQGTDPTQLQIITYLPNCQIQEGVVRRLIPMATDLNAERNRPGAVIRIAAEVPSREITLFGGDLQPTSVRRGNESWYIALRQKRCTLPFTVRLVDFEKRFHPKTSIPKNFSSRIEVNINGVIRELTISMNRPFRYRDYTLFQTSYADLPGGVESSTLAVTQTQGRLLPYVATFVTCAGLLIHFLSGGMRRRMAVAAVGLTILAASGNTVDAAQSTLDMPLNEFAAIPIQEGGRLMPLDTYARLKLLQMTGRRTINGKPAVRWLADVFFRPEESTRDSLFLVNHPDVIVALHLRTERPRVRCSFVELEKSLPELKKLAYCVDVTDEKDRTPAEREFLRLYAAVVSYRELFYGLHASLIPPPGVAGDVWRSPQEVLKANRDMDALRALSEFRVMGGAYRKGDIAEFNRSCITFRRFVEGRIGARPLSRLGAELVLNRLALFDYATVAYLVALLTALGFTAFQAKRLRWLSFVLLMLGWLPHTVGIACRSFIMARPPVTNLYSTFLFVAWAVAVMGWMVELRQKNGLGLIGGSVGSFLLMVISQHFAVSGDTMQKVVAVLDSNLWLTAHVLTIMFGYAGCLMAGVAGHVYLFQRWRYPLQDRLHQGTYRTLMGLLGTGLFFTFLGTMLGGIWADQSWGRFWGWDPKENGALLIILWCAILIHARPSGILSERGLAVGCIFLNIFVALAWMGVNLLGVGLHAYGFTSGVAMGLIIFVVAELAFIGVSLGITRRLAQSSPIDNTNFNQ